LKCLQKQAYAIIQPWSLYFWFQWKTLSDIGVKIGMNEEEARSTLYNTMIAALDTYFANQA
jgi:pyrroline-5-carboxylate reductase